MACLRPLRLPRLPRPCQNPSFVVPLRCYRRRGPSSCAYPGSRACVELSCGFACPPPPRALRRIVPCLPRFDSIPPSHSPPCRPSSREVAQWEVEQFQADFGATRMQVRGPTGGDPPIAQPAGQGLEPWKALRRQCPVGTWRLYLARWTLGAGALGRAVPGTSSWTAGAHRAGSPRSLQPMERSSGGPFPPQAFRRSRPVGHQILVSAEGDPRPWT